MAYWILHMQMSPTSNDEAHYSCKCLVCVCSPLLEHETDSNVPMQGRDKRWPSGISCVSWSQQLFISTNSHTYICILKRSSYILSSLLFFCNCFNRLISQRKILFFIQEIKRAIQLKMTTFLFPFRRHSANEWAMQNNKLFTYTHATSESKDGEYCIHSKGLHKLLLLLAGLKIETQISDRIQ